MVVPTCPSSIPSTTHRTTVSLTGRMGRVVVVKMPLSLMFHFSPSFKLQTLAATCFIIAQSNLIFHAGFDNGLGAFQSTMMLISNVLVYPYGSPSLAQSLSYNRFNFSEFLSTCFARHPQNFVMGFRWCELSSPSSLR